MPEIPRGVGGSKQTTHGEICLLVKENAIF